MTIERYIAENNTDAAQGILAKYGMGQGTSWDDLHQKLRKVLTNYGDAAATELSKIDTPYKRLIEANIAPTVIEKQVMVQAPVVEKKNCADGGCGCGGNCGGSQRRQPLPVHFSAADGSMAEHFKYMPHITIAALAFMLGYVIAKPK